MVTAETPGQAPYDAYRRATGGLWLSDGNPRMPETVEALPGVLRGAWEAVAAQQPKPAPELTAKPDLRTAWRLADERLALLSEILRHPGTGQVPPALRAMWHKRAGLPS